MIGHRSRYGCTVATELAGERARFAIRGEGTEQTAAAVHAVALAAASLGLAVEQLEQDAVLVRFRAPVTNGAAQQILKSARRAIVAARPKSRAA